jgi:hypothetical protein
MNNKNLENKKNPLDIVLYIVSILLIISMVWIGFSYIEVLSKNLQDGAEYTSFNFFKVILLISGK